MNITWFDSDFYTLILRLSINLLFLIVVIRYLYYPKTKRKDYLFTYFLIGFMTFFLCFGLKKLDIDIYKKKFNGEVFTPMDIVNEMLDTLP